MIAAPEDFQSQVLTSVPNGGLFWKSTRTAGEVAVGMVVRHEDNADGSGTVLWLTGVDAFSFQEFTVRATTAALMRPVGQLGIELKTPLVAVEHNWTKGHLLLAEGGAFIVVQGVVQGFPEIQHVRVSDWNIVEHAPSGVGLQISEWRLVCNDDSRSTDVIASVGDWT
ncbi:hypothetical protein ACF3M1_02540 [Luteimonas sp. WGS1318]|uniref:hypothetical protein n=1 Tax=Luteimonas sp. WGS1318 TaxID=3366815 RepID=UPI00372D56C7